MGATIWTKTMPIPSSLQACHIEHTEFSTSYWEFANKSWSTTLCSQNLLLCLTLLWCRAPLVPVEKLQSTTHCTGFTAIDSLKRNPQLIANLQDSYFKNLNSQVLCWIANSTPCQNKSLLIPECTPLSLTIKLWHKMNYHTSLPWVFLVLLSLISILLIWIFKRFLVNIEAQLLEWKRK